ncbi:MAG: T9SS type A sorting domain-containing protein, partial [Mariniphaga sp.]|nr:T9SS type A sorting domain-containing protein [Mariniphaga sp.]
ITYGNTANVAAKGVPFWFAISNHEDMEIEFIDFEIAPIQKKEGFEEFYKDDPFYEVDSFLGEAFNARSLSLYIPVIPANSTQSITMRVKSSETYKTITWLDKPLYHTSYDTVKSMLYNKSGTNLIEDDFIPDPADMTKASCWMSIVFEMVIDAGAGVVNPWVGCIQSVLNNVFDVHGYGGVRPKRKTLQHWVATYSGVAIECAMAHYPKVWIGKIAGITFSNLAYHMTAESCSDAKIKKHNEMRKVTSFDPNEKDGPTGYGESNYIGSTDFLDYTIYFENKSSATAPAHTIIVSDTLDTDIFDLSKTEINSVTIGDTTFYALPGSTEFLKSASLEHLGVDARITVSSNENTGSLNCIIRSFDPDTDEEIEDPFVGVLPPNVTSPEGEGSVSFRLFLKEEPQHNQVIKNKAIIYFDGNEPIITNEYINTFDLQAPVTEVESYTVDGTITLNLSGTDSGSGIDYYEIWMAKGDEGFDLWKISKENTVEFRSTETDNYKFYSVGVDNLGNTEAAPEIADIDVYATSVEIFVITEKVKYYPNPASKKINIEIDLDEAREIDIYITNLNGQNIKCLSNLLLPQGKTTLKENLEGIPNGMYLLNIQIENQIFGDQIIILN